MVNNEDALRYFTQQQIDEMHRYSVKSQREKYSDQSLWEKIEGCWQDENVREFGLHKAWFLAHSTSVSREYWEQRWQWLVDVKILSRNVYDLVAGHLRMRGDTRIETWLEEREKERRECSLRCLNEAYRLYGSR